MPRRNPVETARPSRTESQIHRSYNYKKTGLVSPSPSPSLQSSSLRENVTYPNGSLPMRRPSRNFEQWVPQHGNAYMSSQQFLDGNSAQSLTYPNGNSASQYPVGQQQLVPGYPVAQVAPQSSQFPSPNTAYQTGQMFGQEYTIPLRPRPVTQETMANNNGQLSNGDPVTNSPPPPYTQYSQTPQGGVGALQPSVVPPIERIPTPVTASENFTPIQPAPAPAPAPDSGRCASNKARNARHLLLRRTRKALAAISTERTHEENQERAYIAASRRSDRSLEARIQSAHQASDIHKQRTGKALRITDEVVRNEEMYEEEEDDFPRSFRLLSHNLQQPEMNGNLSGRAEVFLSTRVEVSRMMQQNQDDWARQNKINKEFADAFPNHNKYAQRAPSVSTDQMYGSGSGSGSGSYLDFNAPMQYSPSTQPNFAPVNYTQPAGQNSRGQSFSAMTPTEQQPATPASQELTPAAQEPSSAPQLAPYFSYEGTAAPGQSGMLYNQATSAFTSELSNDARMLMGAQMSWDGSAQPTFDNAMDFQSTSYFQMPTAGNEQDLPSDYPDLTSQPQDSAEEPNWSNFIDDNEWMEPYDADAYNQGQNANQD